MPTRQELYDRIRESNKAEVILEEMVRLGFWPRDTPMSDDPPDEAARRAQLEKELRSLTVETSQLSNAEALKKAARKQRMKESREKRKETKERRLRERKERAEAWQRQKETEIAYLGQGVSGGLHEKDNNPAQLKTNRLPVFADVTELAGAMEITLGALRFLAFSRRTSTTTHYHRFAIPKKTGGLRQISAPKKRLKIAQEWILHNILDKMELHRAAHGFRPGRSIVSNATPHVGAEVVINVDIQDFFPTITFKRIRGMFRSMGYSEQTATVLALICSEPQMDTVELDGKTYYVARTERFLPQGAPSSPAITNIICRGLDVRLTKNAQDLGFAYTRYADDITFSGSGVANENIGKALRRLDYIIRDEGFEIHPDKTRVLRKSRRQEVTGLVVNEQLSVNRPTLRKFRATLFQIEKDGPAGKQWGQAEDVLEAIEGFANFVAMVDKEKGAELQRRVKAIVKKYRR